MAGLNASARNAAVDGLAAVTTHVGLLDASGTELTGGSPAYARKAVTWGAAAAGIRASTTAALLFDVPASTTVAFYGLYSAVSAGTNHAILPVQGAAAALPMACTLDNATDFFTSYAHGFVNTDRCVLSDVSSATLQATFDENTVYYVVNKTTDTFQLSLTSGGSAVTATVSFECFVTKCVPEAFVAQGQYNIAIGAISLDANLI